MTSLTVNVDNLAIFACSFATSALAGLAALLRSGDSVTIKKSFSSILNSGLLGLGVSLLWYLKFQDNLYFLVGICVLLGLGGMTTVDFILKVIRNGGLHIRVNSADGSVELPDVNNALKGVSTPAAQPEKKDEPK